jgi:hypothetical protein
MIYVLIKALFWGDPVQGYPTLVILILFLGGIQLLSLGVIGEYIGRIYICINDSPQYVIKQVTGDRRDSQA